MAIVKMKRLRLIAMRPDREELLKRLQHLGCVEISQPDMDLSDPKWEGLSTPDSGALNEAREAGACLNTALDTLKRYAPAKGGLLIARPEVTEQEFFHDGTYAAALTDAQAINHAQRQIQTLSAERAKLLGQKASLAPWMALDVPLPKQVFGHPWMLVGEDKISKSRGNAIYADENGSYVYRVEGEQHVRCDVTVGITTVSKVEILAGLQEGDEVYVKE